MRKSRWYPHPRDLRRRYGCRKTVAPDDPIKQEDSQPPARGRWSAPATANGRLAFGLAVLAVAVIVANGLLANLVFEGRDDSALERDFDLIRGLLVIVFGLSSIGALVNAYRAIRKNDRGVFVLFGGLIGLLGTLLIVAEFTVME